MPKTFIQNASLDINRIMTESFRQLKDMKLTFFQFPKSSSYMWNLCVQNNNYMELYPITLILKISISGLWYPNYFVLLIDRNNIENYLAETRYWSYY